MSSHPYLKQLILEHYVRLVLWVWRDASKSPGTTGFESLVELRIRGEIKSPNSRRKETLWFTLPEASLCSVSHAAPHHCLQTRIIVLKPFFKTQPGQAIHRDYRRASQGPGSPSPWSPPLFLQDIFCPLSISPGKYMSHLLSSSEYKYIHRSFLFPCSWQGLMPSLSFSLQILFYFRSFRIILHLRDVTFCHDAIIYLICSLSSFFLHILVILLFHTEFWSQEMYELSNIHERALWNEDTSSSVVHISNTNDRGKLSMAA